MLGGEETSSAEVLKQCRHYVLASYSTLSLGQEMYEGGVTHSFTKMVLRLPSFLSHCQP